jgi:hypothetical protein
LNRTEKRIWTFLGSYYQEILSVTKDGKQPDEAHSSEGFMVADLRKRDGLVDLHDETLPRERLALEHKLQTSRDICLSPAGDRGTGQLIDAGRTET